MPLTAGTLPGPVGHRTANVPLVVPILWEKSLPRPWLWVMTEGFSVQVGGRGWFTGSCSTALSASLAYGSRLRLPPPEGAFMYSSAGKT